MTAQREMPGESGSEVVRVTLVVADHAGEAAVVGNALARDAIDVQLVELADATKAPPARPILVAWLPRGVPRDVYDRLIAWRSRAASTTHLIGCAPGGTVDDSERALEAGFDDFVAGRFSVREVSARIRALARRLAPSPAKPLERLRFGRMVLDAGRHELWIGEQRVPLTAMELQVMTALMRVGGRTLSRAELLDQVWGHDELDVGVRAVDNLVCRLRRKMGERDLLVTVRGIGFRLSDR